MAIGGSLKLPKMDFIKSMFRYLKIGITPANISSIFDIAIFGGDGKFYRHSFFAKEN